MPGPFIDNDLRFLAFGPREKLTLLLLPQRINVAKRDVGDMAYVF